MAVAMATDARGSLSPTDDVIAGFTGYLYTTSDANIAPFFL